MKPRLTLLIFMVVCRSALSQIDPTVEALFEKRSHTFENTTLPYRLYCPENYSPDGSYPVLLFLHGAKWAGTDNVTQLDNELALYWIDSTFQRLYPCFVVVPQIPAGQSWETLSGQVSDFPASPNLAVANDMITNLLQEFPIDDNRIYACGKSIGGQGVYGLIARYPSRYAAAIPAAGRYVYNSIQELSKCSWWIFHNRDDTTVPVSQSHHIVEQLENIGEQVVFSHCNFHTNNCDTLPDIEIDSAIQGGARFLFSEFDDSGHQLEPNVVATHGLYPWVMAQKKNPSAVRLKNKDGDLKVLNNYPNPFNGSTTIQFVLEKSRHTTLTVKNLKGQTVAVLQDARLESGTHFCQWQTDEPSGIYFFELKTDEAVRTGRCLILQ